MEFSSSPKSTGKYKIRELGKKYITSSLLSRIVMSHQTRDPILKANEFVVFRQGTSMSGSSFPSSSGSADSSSMASCSGDGKTSPCCVPFLDHDCSDHAKENFDESSMFPHLRSISLNNSMFDCWEEIGQLRIWPSLAELRMQSCPLFRVSNILFSNNYITL
jgi:hypothetical protein